jgi:glycosyltransferase involved in cell wall biosynthesis
MDQSNAPRGEVAIYLPGGRITPPANPYGRLIANAGTFRALAAHPQVAKLHFQCRTPPDPVELAEQVGMAADHVTVATPLITSAAARCGVLFSGQPYLTEPAWVRRHARLDTAYSIVGQIFAFSSPAHREQMMLSSLAPLHDWDALICSSPTLRDTVAARFDAWENYLAERVGATRVTRPHLPVIPFGCDVESVSAQSRDDAARASLRARLGIGPDDVMVYSLGRLSYYDKAFPQPMFTAVAQAAARSEVTTHFVMTGWFPDAAQDPARYRQAAARLAPNVRSTFLDGNDPLTVAQCWAAADVFLLLSDTIIETFGQALVEAMAAGLPLVVSDWDGYRWIVTDGEDGFLVPTLGAPGGPLGETLALLESLAMVDYPTFSGSVAAHTAVNVEQASANLAELLGSPDLRRRMGQSGRGNATKRFTWPVVAGQLLELFGELDARRAASGEPTGHRMPPLRNDPFADFAALPSSTLSAETLLWRTGIALPTADFDTLFAHVRGTDDELQAVLEKLADGPLTLGELLSGVPARRRPFVRMSVMWLAKSGVVDWR